MIINNELQLLRNADPGVVLLGIDTQVGNPLSSSSLVKATTLNQSGVVYDPTHNRVVVTKDGTVLNGVNFGGLPVEIRANNVTIENSSFAAPASYRSIQVDSGFSGTTVTQDTFDSGLVPSPATAWIASGAGQITVTDNKFIDTPGDAVDLRNGVVSGNYFSRVGNSSTGIHADAIWVTNSQGVTILNNFINWTADGTQSFVNNAVRITTEGGSVSNVSVNGNYLLGGDYTITAGVDPVAGRTYSNISITGNYIGDAAYGAFYPGAQSGVTASGNTIIDFTNPIYSTEAWTAYVAAGIHTASVVTSTGANIGSPSSTGSVTLYGAGYRVNLYGNEGETIFVGGSGPQGMMGGLGANIITELAISDSTAAYPDAVGNFNSAKDVIDLSHIDANLSVAGTQSFTFIGTAAFSGAGGQVRYQQDPADNCTWVQADLAGDSSPDLVIKLSGLQTLTAANFALTAAQSTTDMANGAALSFTRTVSGTANEFSYANVQGRAYSSFQSIMYGSGLAANDLNFSSATNEIDLYQNGMTINRGAGSETLKVGTGAFSLGYHATETINASVAGAETFAFGSNFGNETIAGFRASGANANTIQFATSSFSYLNSGMTQAQDLAAVLANATTSGSGTTIHNSKGDNLTLTGLTPSMITAAASQFHFV